MFGLLWAFIFENQAQDNFLRCLGGLCLPSSASELPTWVGTSVDRRIVQCLDAKPCLWGPRGPMQIAIVKKKGGKITLKKGTLEVSVLSDKKCMKK